MDSQPALATDDGVRAVYAAHGPELYRFAVRSLGDRGLAEEAVQETFVRAWRAADRFDDELGSLRTWLFAIVRNVVIDLSRARAVRPGLSANDAADDALFVDEAFDRVLTSWQVEEALRMLSEEHRSALVEVHYKGRAGDGRHHRAGGAVEHARRPSAGARRARARHAAPATRPPTRGRCRRRAGDRRGRDCGAAARGRRQLPAAGDVGSDGGRTGRT